MNTIQPHDEDNSSLPPQPEESRPTKRVLVSLPVSVTYVTYAIMGITIVVYLLQLLSNFTLGYDFLVGLGAKGNEAIRSGQLWRFLTPVLLHGSIFHIGVNMYALNAFGSGLERRYGYGRFILLYILGGFAGTVFSFLFTQANSIGASGAIFGLIGAEGIFLFKNRNLLGKQVGQAINNVVFVVVLNLLLGLQPWIDNWGHIGGLMGGLIFAWFAGPHWEVRGISPNRHVIDRREPRDVIVGTAVVTIIFCTLAAIGMWFPITA